MIVEQERYLEHFGVKGMHWGVRRGRDDGEEFPMSKGKSTAIVVGSGFVVSLLANKVIPMGIVGKVGSGVLGGAGAAAILNRWGDKKIEETKAARQ